jgi:hypothetical protein
MFIDYTYFKDDINLPSQILSGSNDLISDYITKYEKEALINLLGYDQYKELAAQKTADSLDAKWTAFVEGSEYEVEYGSSTYTLKWEGLVNTQKVSFLSYYVYFNFIRDNVTNTSIIGELLSVSENAQRISPSDKMVHAYNRFVDLHGNTSDGKFATSAYRYLYENSDDFDLWLFTPVRKINKFGI